MCMPSAVITEIKQTILPLVKVFSHQSAVQLARASAVSLQESYVVLFLCSPAFELYHELLPVKVQKDQ